jgi:hypothetical protein
MWGCGGGWYYKATIYVVNVFSCADVCPSGARWCVANGTLVPATRPSGLSVSAGNRNGPR